MSDGENRVFGPFHVWRRLLVHETARLVRSKRRPGSPKEKRGAFLVLSEKRRLAQLFGRCLRRWCRISSNMFQALHSVANDIQLALKIAHFVRPCLGEAWLTCIG